MRFLHVDNQIFFIIEKKTACVFLSNSFLIKIIERMEDCYPHINTYLQYGKCRLSRLHTVTLRHRLRPEKEETRSSMNVLQNQCSHNFHKIYKKQLQEPFSRKAARLQTWYSFGNLRVLVQVWFSKSYCNLVFSFPSR